MVSIYVSNVVQLVIFFFVSFQGACYENYIIGKLSYEINAWNL
jgi:hypothetical protein